jgi:hypothetical protein
MLVPLTVNVNQHNESIIVDTHDNIQQPIIDTVCMTSTNNNNGQQLSRPIGDHSSDLSHSPPTASSLQSIHINTLSHVSPTLSLPNLTDSGIGFDELRCYTTTITSNNCQCCCIEFDASNHTISCHNHISNERPARVARTSS